jgi:hypothetical protein
MSWVAWVVCAAWIALGVVVAARRGARGVREGRRGLLVARLKSPTAYLFSAYLLVAALVAPLSPGETTSPLFWLAFALPVTYALSALSAIGSPQPSRREAAVLGILHGGTLLSAAAVILAMASPQFVPAWLR